MAILVTAEHDNHTLKQSTLNTVSASTQLNDEIHVLVAGFNCQAVAEQAAKITGVSKVLYADSSVYEHQLAENIAALITELGNDYYYILAPATSNYKNILPRVAAKLDVTQLSDITAIVANDTFERPIYAGNAIATVKSLDPVKVITVRSSAFEEAAFSDSQNAEIIAVNALPETNLVAFVSEQVEQSDRPELSNANIIISGGRGLGSSENFALIEQLADQLGAAVGASRAAVDSGFVPNDKQVGQTGKIVAPQLYIAVGISGAIQHLAGMKDSKTIVAINKDEEAPIFSVADYGLVADLFEVIPELREKLP
ncbi:electron transfer flavoprotein subunit alpha/FixB family protein [Sessilibacter corallicola]|uniref:electron transfer flavoprotein subunit alpha/FixB family protein n=1 Tax=Sessilibacter corallicola TaxID=2904075 RepID=UPI001E50DFB7|nr:FAD-binding protein [Sessilibacter corallicola]MCE2029043.1 FAD-binding protein [Sessilibacter corallicola]